MGQAKNRGNIDIRIQQAKDKQAKLQAETLAMEEEAKRKAQEWWAGLSSEDRKKEIAKEKKRFEFQKMLGIIMHPPLLFKDV
ncbi:MAG: hypothetical protein M0R48_10960 [Candidatus Omnitrophica bacterium]|nr:hypothetical protein [Candidatus Omnitrophota bacterium]